MAVEVLVIYGFSIAMLILLHVFGCENEDHKFSIEKKVIESCIATGVSTKESRKVSQRWTNF